VSFTTMTWDDVLERLGSAGLNPREEIYIDNYGNILPLEHPQFGRVADVVGMGVPITFSEASAA